MIDFYRVGMKITQHRKRLNMTQDDLANQLYVTRQALSKWENGTSVPSIDTVIQLSKVFKTSIDDILCLDDRVDEMIDSHDIFSGKDRMIVLNRIIKSEISVDIPSIFYQLSNEERMLVLKAIKEKRITCNLNDLSVRLTQAEQKYLFNHIYIRGGNKL